MGKKIVLLLIILVISLTSVIAHGTEREETGFLDITGLSLRIVYIVSAILIGVSLLSIVYEKKMKHWMKSLAFWIITIPVLITTIFIVGSTLYLNITSPTKGPVHWHADFEIEICDMMIEIKDPEGIFNRIGEADLHEHNDMRIHVEGTPASLEDIELGEFFRVLGGEFTSNRLVVPTEEGLLSADNGQICNGKPGRLMLFVQGQKGIDRVWRLEPSMDEYIIAPYGNVPPGDRLMIVFTDMTAEEKLAEIKEGHV